MWCEWGLCFGPTHVIHGDDPLACIGRQSQDPLDEVDRYRTRTIWPQKEGVGNKKYIILLCIVTLYHISINHNTDNPYYLLLLSSVTESAWTAVERSKNWQGGELKSHIKHILAIFPSFPLHNQANICGGRDFIDYTQTNGPFHRDEPPLSHIRRSTNKLPLLFTHTGAYVVPLIPLKLANWQINTHPASCFGGVYTAKTRRLAAVWNSLHERGFK